MLRMVVDADGQQRTRATTPEYHIPRDDLRALSEEQRIALEKKRRHELKHHRVLACRPVASFELVVSEIDDLPLPSAYELRPFCSLMQSFKVMMDDGAGLAR